MQGDKSILSRSTAHNRALGLAEAQGVKDGLVVGVVRHDTQACIRTEAETASVASYRTTRHLGRLVDEQVGLLMTLLEASEYRAKRVCR